MMPRMTTIFRSVLPSLIGGLLIHCVAVLAPHRHGLEAVHSALPAADHWCTHDTPEALPVSGAEAGATCLACVISAPTLDAPESDPECTDGGASAGRRDRSSPSHAPARRWTQPLRGPPVSPA